MSCTAIVNISPECNDAITQFKTDSSKRAIKLNIVDEVLTPVETIDVNGNEEQDFDALGDHLESNAPAFMIVRLGKSVSHPEYLFLVYIPPSSPIRPRTIFASSRVPVQRHIATLFSSLGDYFVDRINEIQWSQYMQITRKDESAYSYDEIQLKLDSQEQAVAQVQLPQHDSFTWPVADDLKSLLKQMASGEGPRVIAGAASDRGEAISIGSTGEQLDDIQAKSPRYVAIRYSPEMNVFVLFCPDTAKPREKMMSSTCKHSFLVGCEECGLKFAKSFDVRDPSELNESNLELLIHPPEVDHGYGEVKILRKPRRPGRPAK